MKSLLIFLTIYLFSVLAQDSSVLSLSATIYDFSNADSGTAYAHPDFNSFGGSARGMVSSTLGPDRKPVLIDTKGVVTSKETFDQWFNSVPGVNYVFPTYLTAYWDPSRNAYTYDNFNFFPIDGQGYGNEWYSHNYGFCMELHSKFTYQTGQIFDFAGDDDVWVFINDELVIDLGGVHPTETGSVDLDSLGLTVGKIYPFDFFFCERHIVGSNLRWSTSIELNPCGLEDTDQDGIGNLCDNCPNGSPTLHIDTRETSTSLTVLFKVSFGNPVVDDIEVEVDFGDGKTESMSLGSDTEINHTYAKSGDYTVTVSFEGGNGCEASSDSVDITIKNNRIAPSCGIKYSPY